MSSKQARVQLELNDLAPQQDPKGGTHPPIGINLTFLPAVQMSGATLLVPYFSVDVADTSSTSWLGSRVISSQKG